MSSRRSTAIHSAAPTGDSASTADPASSADAASGTNPASGHGGKDAAPVSADPGDRTGSIVFAVLAMLVATLTTIPAANLVKERLADGGDPSGILLPVLAAFASGVIVAAVFAISVRMSGLGAIVVGALLIIASIAFLVAPAALMNVDPGTGYWHALSAGSSWISITGGFAAAGAVLIGIGVGTHYRRLGRTAGPPAMSVAGVLLAVAGSLLAAYAGTGSAKPAVFLLSAKVGDANLYWRMLSGTHYLTLFAVLAIGLILLVAAGYTVRWSPWGAVIAGALLEIPVLIMVLRPRWIIGGSASVLHSTGAGTNIGEFILFGGLGLIGIALLGGGIGTMMVGPALAPASEAPGDAGDADNQDAAANASDDAADPDDAGDSENAAGPDDADAAPTDSATAGAARDEEPQRGVDEELRSGE